MRPVKCQKENNKFNSLACLETVSFNEKTGKSFLFIRKMTIHYRTDQLSVISFINKKLLNGKNTEAAEGQCSVYSKSEEKNV